MRSALALLGALLGGLLPAALAAAQVHVVPPGREAVVMALFAPHRLGGEVAEGWTLHGIAIDRDRIEVTLAGPSEARAGLTLRHPSVAPEGATSTPSFAVETSGDASGAAPREALLAALRANDDGAFWESAGEVATSALPPDPERPPWLDALTPRSSRGSPAVPLTVAVLAVLGVLAGTLLLRRGG